MIWLWLFAVLFFVARERETQPPAAALHLGFHRAAFWSPRALPLMALTGIVIWILCLRFWGLALLPGWSPIAAWQKWLAVLLAIAAALLMRYLARPAISAPISCGDDHLSLPPRQHAVRVDKVPWRQGPAVEGRGRWLVVTAKSRRYRYARKAIDHPDPLAALSAAVDARLEASSDTRGHYARRRALLARPLGRPWGTAMLVAAAVVCAALPPTPAADAASPFPLPGAYRPLLMVAAGLLTLRLGRRLERLLGPWPTLVVAALGGLSAAAVSGRLSAAGPLAAPGPLALFAALLGGLLDLSRRYGPGLPGRDRLTMLEVLIALLGLMLYVLTDLVGVVAGLAAALGGAVAVVVLTLARPGLTGP